MDTTRRRFFGQLATIIAASMAPSVLIPSSDAFHWKPILKPKFRKLKAVWTCELEQDLIAYYHADAETTLTSALQETISLDTTDYYKILSNENQVQKENLWKG
jgi:hypothetical protein